MGATAPVVLLLRVITLLKPQHNVFVHAFCAPLQRTRSSNHRGATSFRHDSGSLQFSRQKCRHRRLADVTALNMAGFWEKPPLEEVSVLELPVLRQGSDDVAVVYFTACDLRVHDHDGLVAAAKAARVLPVYVFDDQVCQGLFSCASFGWWYCNPPLHVRRASELDIIRNPTPLALPLHVLQFAAACHVQSP